MNPEPLKNKLFEVPLDYDDAHYGIPTQMIKVVTEGQIKSAVEWLKHKLKFNNVQNEFVMVKEVYQLIDEAFEDVMKKKKRV